MLLFPVPYHGPLDLYWNNVISFSKCPCTRYVSPSCMSHRLCVPFCWHPLQILCPMISLFFWLVVVEMVRERLEVCGRCAIFSLSRTVSFFYLFELVLCADEVMLYLNNAGSGRHAPAWRIKCKCALPHICQVRRQVNEAHNPAG